MNDLFLMWLEKEKGEQVSYKKRLTAEIFLRESIVEECRMVNNMVGGEPLEKPKRLEDRSKHDNTDTHASSRIPSELEYRWGAGMCGWIHRLCIRLIGGHGTCCHAGADACGTSTDMAGGCARQTNTAV